jgi:hypothetical protein
MVHMGCALRSSGEGDEWVRGRGREGEREGEGEGEGDEGQWVKEGGFRLNEREIQNQIGVEIHSAGRSD